MLRQTSERPVYTCETCAFSLWLPIAQLSVSTLGLYDDARFPGRCLLAFHRHEEDLTALAPDDLSGFMKDLQRSSRAISSATKPMRMNYALLGNQEQHVHFHLIPRPIGDPVPTKTPWQHPEALRALDAEARSAIIAAIAQNLAASGD